MTAWTIITQQVSSRSSLDMSSIASVTDLMSRSDKIRYFCESRMERDFGTVHNCKYYPSDIDEAYEIQKAVTEKLDQKIGAWKLGGTNPWTREAFACSDAYWGPIFAENVLHAHEVNIINWGFECEPRAEAEIAFRLAKDVRPDEIVAREIDLPSLFDCVAPSLEFPVNFYSDVVDHGLPSLIADLCGSGYLVLGPPIQIDWQAIAMPTAVTVVERAEIASGTSGSLIGGTQEILKDFLRSAGQRGFHFKKGQWVATGGCTPCVPIRYKEPLTVRFENLKALKFSLLLCQ